MDYGEDKKKKYYENLEKRLESEDESIEVTLYPQCNSCKNNIDGKNCEVLGKIPGFIKFNRIDCDFYLKETKEINEIIKD